MSSRRWGRWLFLWLPVLAWMVVIFWFSDQQGLPTVPSGLFDTVIHKAAHTLEYALLGVLLLRAWSGTLDPASRPGANADGSTKAAWATPSFLAVALGGLYAISDEVHQLVVPTRHGQWQDVVVDVVAIVLGVALARWWQGKNGRSRQ